ncbi:MAG: Glu/Leu/Phe/Val dehydrogenase [Acidimicrobiia bacterium]
MLGNLGIDLGKGPPRMKDGLFGAIGAEGHECVLWGSDPDTGLRAIVAVHSTVLGPSLGGTRFYPYETEEAALVDALRLSRAMTLKAAVSGLDLGGGKAVIMGDPARNKSEGLLRAYGRLVDRLGGRYITAEDIGTTLEDMEIIYQETEWVSGLPLELGGSGDPSPATARGVLYALRAVSRHLWGTEELEGRRVVVQGVGKVGSALVEDLVEAGCEVLVGDMAEDAVARVVEAFGVQAVPASEVLYTECDILAPCAIGSVLNAGIIPRLRCRAVVGSANNQLEAYQDAELLAERGILYAPDFIVNAGGLINIFEEFRGYSAERAARSVEAVYDTTLRVLSSAREWGVSAAAAALRLAEQRIAEARGD